MARVKKVKAPPSVLIPDSNPNVKRWIVLGLDPSMSRTGFAFMDVRPPLAQTPEENYTEANWVAAGSIKPTPIDDPHMDARSTVWIRAKAIAITVREYVKRVVPSTKAEKGDLHVCKTADCCRPDVGLIICMEYPTPQNDYLWSVNRIINLIMFEDNDIAPRFAEVRILLVNASTNRSIMGLVKRGSTNKVENIAKAYEFIDKKRFPELDTESCDGVLMAMWGRYAASVMMGTANEIPDTFKLTLCNGTQEGRGKGQRARTITKGILHRNEYWYPYKKRNYEVSIKDASQDTKKLAKLEITI